jgi:hypothetical protein
MFYSSTWLSTRKRPPEDVKAMIAKHIAQRLRQKSILRTLIGFV